MDVRITVHLSPRQKDWIMDVAAGRKPRNGHHRNVLYDLCRMGLVKHSWSAGHTLTDLGWKVLWEINEQKDRKERKA